MTIFYTTSGGLTPAFVHCSEKCGRDIRPGVAEKSVTQVLRCDAQPSGTFLIFTEAG